MKTTNSNLSKYLTVSVSAGLTATSSAAITVYNFDPGLVNSSESPNVPDGISIGTTGTKDQGYVDTGETSNTYFGVATGGKIFTQDENFDPGSKAFGSSSNSAQYSKDGDAENGAVIDGATPNYAAISFDGNDGVYEAVGKFIFDGAGGGYLSALAIDDGQEEIPIPIAIAALNPIPETSALSLLALGATGLLLRRNRKVA